MVDEGWLGSVQSEIFLQMKFIIFQGCPTKQASFLPGHSAPYNNVTNITLLLKLNLFHKSFMKKTKFYVQNVKVVGSNNVSG